MQQFRDTHENMAIQDAAGVESEMLVVKEVVHDYSGQPCVSFSIADQEVYVSPEKVQDLIEKLNNFLKHNT